MKTGRLEAFSDGVLAIIITIMVLELKAPKGSDFEALMPVIPVFLTYLLSFVYVGIYWNNHHHLFQAVKLVNGKILWANLNLLFWLSFFPFVTGWMGQNHFEANPTALYGAVLLMAAIAFRIVIFCVVQNEGQASSIGRVYSTGKRMKLSLFLYSLGMAISFFFPIISLIIYLGVALMWIVPDPRIEKALKD